MKRLDMILRVLAEKTEGMTAGQLADELGLARANVSNDLNELCREGRAVKEGIKPVYYRLLPKTGKESDEKQADFFKRDENEFLRKNPSLTNCFLQARAAVLYPPHVMPILLLGETGVGKSMLAEKIYQIAKHAGILQNNAPYVIFNCADYANNPQLLMSYLFGTKKGAYTGASEDREGILERADKGILFLDEVHRLSPEGQEMLFSFIDRGIFYRLGDTQERSATVQLICATTEDPKTALQSTFVRRIPMVIQIPSLAQRTEKERFTLIHDMILVESARIKRPIYVTPNAMRCLLAYPCPHNIGQLKTDIQILCARAYANFLSEIMEDVVINSPELPEHIRSALYHMPTTSMINIGLRVVNKRPMLCFSAEDPVELNIPGHVFPQYSVYDLIEDKTRELRYQGLTEQEIGAAVGNEILQYHNRFMDIAKQMDLHQLSEWVSTDIISTAEHILETAEKALNTNFSEAARNGIAMHIHNALIHAKTGRATIHPQTNEIRKNFPLAFNVALDALQIIQAEMFVVLPLDEVAFLAPFFCSDDMREGSPAPFHIIVIMHGSRTASALTETVSEMLNQSLPNTIALNMPTNQPLNQVYDSLRAYLNGLPNQADILFLYDMGSVTDLIGRAKEEYPGFNIQFCPLVSTSHVIEAVMDAGLGHTLEYTYNKLLYISKVFRRPLEHIGVLPVQPVDTLPSVLSDGMDETINSAVRSLSSVVEFLNVNEAVRVARAAALRCAKRLNKEIDIQFVVCSIFHLVCTLERIAVDGHGAAPFENRENYIQRHSEVFQVLQEECQNFANAFGLAFTDDDLCAYSLFFTQA